MKSKILTASLALCVCSGLPACGGADGAPAVDASAMPANTEPRLAAAATTLKPTTEPARLLPEPWDDSP